MSPRPLVRVEVVDEGLSTLMRKTFGSATKAFENLTPVLNERGVTWFVFQRAFVSKPVEKRVVRAIQEAMDNFVESLWEETKSRRKEREKVSA